MPWANASPESRSVQPCLHRSPQSVPVLYSGSPVSPSKLPLLMGGPGPHVIMVPWAHPSPEPKQQLDRFSRFAGLSRCCLQILWNLADGNSVKPCVIYLTKKIKISPASPTLTTAWIVPKIWQCKRLKPCILSQAKLARICTNYRDFQIRHTGKLTLWSRSGDDGLMSMSLFEPCIVSSCDTPLSVVDGAIVYRPTTTQKSCNDWQRDISLDSNSHL